MIQWSRMGRVKSILCKFNFEQRFIYSVDSRTKWQGDESILIDRFDARNLLDIMPKKPKIGKPVPSKFVLNSLLFIIVVSASTNSLKTCN